MLLLAQLKAFIFYIFSYINNDEDIYTLIFIILLEQPMSEKSDGDKFHIIEMASCAAFDRGIIFIINATTYLGHSTVTKFTVLQIVNIT